MSFCTECGAELAEQGEYCSKCGKHKKVEEASSPTPPGLPPSGAPQAEPSPSAATTAATAASGTASGGPETPKKKLSGCAIAAIVGGAFVLCTAVIGVLVIGIAFSATSPAVDAMEAHFEALKQGNIDLAYQGTSAEFRESTPIESYRQFVAAYPILTDVADSSFNNREVANGIATIQGTIEDSTGREEEFHAKLIKEGENWKILGINLPNVNTSGNVESGDSSVGRIVIGAGRNADGSLVNPGAPLPVSTQTLSAQVEMINHAAGETVEVFIRQGSNRTESIQATDLAAGSFSMPADIDISGAGFPPGKYELVVLIAGAREFSQEFELR